MQNIIGILTLISRINAVLDGLKLALLISIEHRIYQAHINVKITIIVDILTFISMISAASESFKVSIFHINRARNVSCSY